MKRKHNPIRSYQLGLFGAVFLFVVTAALASQRLFFPLERDIFFAFYDLPGALLWPMWIITQFGSGWLFLAVGIYLLIGRKRSQHRGRIVVIGGALTYVLVEASKFLIARARPNVIDTDVLQRDLLTLHDFGFPSGHAAMATILSLTLMNYLPAKWRFLPWVWIPLVSISRLYLGVHAPLDIAGGVAIGVIVYCLVKLVPRR